LFNRKRSQLARNPGFNRRGPAIEILEGRRLLSASAHAALAGGGHPGATLEFSQAPAKVQAGFDSLATADGLADPTSTQTVYLSNVNGVERYSVDLTGTGTTTVLTVNQNGTAVTSPTKSTTTFGDLQTADSAAANEITAIASALNLTAPTSTTTINVTTPSGGTAVYSVRLSSSSTSGGRGATVTVDANGNPVGNQNLPFSVIPSTIQAGLTSLAGTTIDSTATVHVRTLNGVTSYSTTLSTGTGTSKTVTVNASGAAANLPSTTQTTLGALQSSDAAAATELQTLANDDGYSGTLPTSTVVSAYDEANGTTIYTISVPVTQSSSSGSSSTYTINLTLSVDQDGNPTVLPIGGGRGEGFGGGGCDGDGGGSSSSSTSTTSSGSTSTTSGISNSGSFVYGLAFRRR
jgi:hypothetical protein